ATGAVTNSIGNILARVQQSGEAFEIAAELQHVPIDFWHVVHARLPQIPIEELQGRVSAKLLGQLVDAENWTFDFEQLEASGVSILAPELVGADPARLALVSASGRGSLVDSVMTVADAQVTC